MKTNRKELLDKLKGIICAATKNETIEQSNCFVFTDNAIVAFDGETFAATKFEYDKEFAVNAFDLVQLVSRINDEEVSLEFKKDQLILSGKKKRAGLVAQKEILLPFENVPKPERMMKVTEDNLLESMQMAAKICSSNEDNYRTSHVHVNGEVIESTDRLRVFRLKTKTGVDEMMIPAKSLLRIGMQVTHIEMVEGWLWMKDDNKKVMTAVCCAEGEYFEESTLKKILNMKGSSTIELPEEMIDVINRSVVMTEEGCDKEAQVHLKSSVLTIKTQKDSGWYEEKQRVKYKGEEMKLVVNLSLLKDIMNRTRTAQILPGRMKIEKDDMELVVCLEE